MEDKIEKSVNEALVLANVLKNVYKSSQDDGEKVSSDAVVNMLNLIIEKVIEIKSLCSKNS